MISIDTYTKESFSFPIRNGHIATHDVYTREKGTKALILIQELPGIGQDLTGGLKMMNAKC